MIARRGERIATAVGLLVVVFALVPAALVGVANARFGSANPMAGVPPFWRWDLSRVGQTFSEPLADSSVADLLIRVSLLTIWVAVAVILLTTVAETIHMARYRGIALPAVSGLGWVQPLARWIAVGLIAIAPFDDTRVSLASAHGDDAHYGITLPRDSTENTGVDVLAPTPGHPNDERPASSDGFVHVVRRGESVYSISSDLAGGDPARTAAIADAVLDANLGGEMSGGARFTNPAYIEVGWRLIVPGDLGPVHVPSVANGSSVHVVAPGDTLSGIAKSHLGSGGEWPAIWEANAGAEMGGGRTFDDPDLILPGWSLDVPEPIPSEAVDAELSRPDIDGSELPETTPGRESGVDDIVGTRPEPAAAPPTSIDPVRAPEPTEPSEPTPTTAVAPPSAIADVVPPATTTTTVAATGADTDSDVAAEPGAAPAAPSPVRVETAAMLAAGVLALVAVRRRRRLRAARPRSRVPEPRAAASAMERRLRLVDPGERAQRVDVAVRAAASRLVGAGAQIGMVTVARDGAVTLRLTGSATLPAPWTGDGSTWELPAATPIEMVTDAARQVGTPCVALAQLGVSADGCDVLVDLEACPVLLVEGRPEVTDLIIAGLTTSLAASPYAEVAHLVTVTVPEAALLDHRNSHRVDTADAALELATSLAGDRADDLETSFELRSVRTGGEAWEPAVVLLRSADHGAAEVGVTPPVAPGAGLAIVMADDERECRREVAGCRLRVIDTSWVFEGFGTMVRLAPIGVSTRELDELAGLLGEADTPLVEPEAAPLADAEGFTRSVDSAFAAPPHAIVVGLLGEVRVADAAGDLGTFERSKTVELIAWLATHRERSTRTAARTALWELDVRDATFANVVSEARRALARLVAPRRARSGWRGRSTNSSRCTTSVVTDAAADRTAARRGAAPAPGAGDRDAPAGGRDDPRHPVRRDAATSGPTPRGSPRRSCCWRSARRPSWRATALSVGDIDTVFWATGRGLTVLPGPRGVDRAADAGPRPGRRPRGRAAGVGVVRAGDRRRRLVRRRTGPKAPRTPTRVALLTRARLPPPVPTRSNPFQPVCVAESDTPSDQNRDANEDSGGVRPSR